MNKQQVNDLQARLETILKAGNIGYTAAQYDVEAGVEITVKSNTQIGSMTLKAVFQAAEEANCLATINVEGNSLLIEVVSTENGSLPDEAMVKYDKFEQYERSGGKLTFEQWIELPENKHLDV